MLQLSLQDIVCGAVYLIELPIRLAACVPALIERVPAFRIVRCVIEILVVSDVRNELVVSVLEHVIRHRKYQPRMDRRPWHDSFQCRVNTLSRRPLRESFIAASVHTYLAVTPRLFADPVDRVVRILCLVFPGDDLTRAASLTAGIGDHPNVSIGSSVPGLLHLSQTRVDR